MLYRKHRPIFDAIADADARVNMMCELNVEMQIRRLALIPTFENAGIRRNFDCMAGSAALMTGRCAILVQPPARPPSATGWSASTKGFSHRPRRPAVSAVMQLMRQYCPDDGEGPLVLLFYVFLAHLSVAAFSHARSTSRFRHSGTWRLVRLGNWRLLISAA